MEWLEWLSTHYHALLDRHEPPVSFEEWRTDWRDGRRYTHQQKREETRLLWSRYQEGLSLARIAKEVGVTRQTVHERFRRAGYKMRSELQLKARCREDLVVVYRGVRYTPTKEGYLRSTSKPRHSLHWRVWVDARGPIPAHHQVWFKDGDPRNYSIENLHIVDRRRRRVKVELRTCGFCNDTMQRHAGECPSAYVRRRYCSRRCASARRRKVS